MIFDGTTIANLVHEFKETPGGGRISKIAQPGKDEFFIAIKNNKESYHLQISANASLPLIHLTGRNKPSPMTAPNFRMLLRKHIGSARIVDTSQPSLERTIQSDLEHLGKMGDLCRRKLTVETMDKYNNIIFCREDGTIIDSIKYVPTQVSSVREVLLGRSYFTPQTIAKENPPTVTQETFHQAVDSFSMPVQKALYSHLVGISPIMAEGIYHLTSTDSDHGAPESPETEFLHLYHTFSLVIKGVKEGDFIPVVVFDEGGPVEYVAFSLTCYESGTYHSQSFWSMSCLLEEYYVPRDTITRTRQKSSDLRRVVQTSLECNYKKHDLQLKQPKDTEKHEKYHIYGELLNTYSYELTGGERSFICLNYYTNGEIAIPLGTQLSAKDDAKKHSDRCNKLERTYEALTDLTREAKAEIDHLESISSIPDVVLAGNDLVQTKEELVEYGYIKKRRSSDKKPKVTSKSFHYISSDGFHVYVEKNNYQNKELVFKLVTGNDWWFRAKGVPGFHVIVKAKDRTDLPDRLSEEAGFPATYYSKGRDNDKVEINYIQKKNVKKAAGAVPGFVIYHINYSLVMSPGCVLGEVG